MFLTPADHLHADRLFELEHQTGADRFDDGRGATLLPLHRVIEITVLGRVDVGNSAAAGHVRHPVAQQFPPDRQHPRSARSTDELVRAQDTASLYANGSRPGPPYISMSTYGPAAAKSHKDNAP